MVVVGDEEEPLKSSPPAEEGAKGSERSSAALEMDASHPSADSTDPPCAPPASSYRPAISAKVAFADSCVSAASRASNRVDGEFCAACDEGSDSAATPPSAYGAAERATHASTDASDSTKPISSAE